MKEELKLHPSLEGFSVRTGEVTLVTSPFYNTLNAFLAQVAASLMYNDYEVLIIHAERYDEFNELLVTSMSKLIKNNRIPHTSVQKWLRWGSSDLSKPRRDMLNTSAVTIASRCSQAELLPAYKVPNFQVNAHTVINQCKKRLEQDGRGKLKVVILTSIFDNMLDLDNKKVEAWTEHMREIPSYASMLRDSEVAVIAGALSGNYSTEPKLRMGESVFQFQYKAVEHIYRVSSLLAQPVHMEVPGEKQWLSHYSTAGFPHMERIPMHYSDKYKQYKTKYKQYKITP